MHGDTIKGPTLGRRVTLVSAKRLASVGACRRRSRHEFPKAYMLLENRVEANRILDAIESSFQGRDIVVLKFRSPCRAGEFITVYSEQLIPAILKEGLE